MEVWEGENVSQPQKLIHTKRVLSSALPLEIRKDAFEAVLDILFSCICWEMNCGSSFGKHHMYEFHSRGVYIMIV